MRIIVILTVMTITTAVLAYNFMRGDAAAERPQAGTSQTSATSGLEVEDRLDELASALRGFQQTNQEQLQEAELQQARLNRMLADLDTRFRSVETRAGEQTTRAVASDSAERGTDTAVPNSGAGKPESTNISEADLGHWMKESLRVGDVDRDLTKLAIEQAAKSLSKVPDTYLEDMECSERFCRATFGNEKGEPPAIQSLFGEPPFVNEGFIINEADGRVAVYFTRPGESLEDLRREAQKAAELAGR